MIAIKGWGSVGLGEVATQGLGICMYWIGLV
jgi:hypothetical protein